MNAQIPLGARRLREFREKRDLSRAKLAEAVGVHHNQIQKLENGERRLATNWIEKLAPVLGVKPADFLAEDERESESPPDLPSAVMVGEESYTPVGRYDVRLSAGPGSLVEPVSRPEGWHLIETQWLRAVSRAAPDQLAVVRVDGTSMFPTLLDGDWVLVDRTQIKVAREGIFAIAVQDIAWVKRLSLNLADKKVRIISDNTAIPPQDIDEDELSVIGRVVAVVARRIA